MKFSWPKGLAPGIKKLLSRYQYVLLVLAAGVLLLLLPLGGGEEEDHTQTPAQLQEEFDLEVFEDRLAGALSQIQGAGEAQVVLTLKSGSRQVLAQDTQRGLGQPGGGPPPDPGPPVPGGPGGLSRRRGPGGVPPDHPGGLRPHRPGQRPDLCVSKSVGERPRQKRAKPPHHTKVRGCM